MSQASTNLLLKQIARSFSGLTLRNGLELKKEGFIPVLQPKDILKGEEPAQPLYLDHYPPSIQKHFLSDGDILLANKGTKFATYLHKGDIPCIASASFFVIRVQKNCLAEYLHWYLEQPVAKDYFLKNSVTSTIPSLSKSVLDDLPVPLPPLSIQASVVEKLRLLNQQEKILAEMLRKTREFRDAHVWDVITNDLNKIL